MYVCTHIYHMCCHINKYDSKSSYLTAPAESSQQLPSLKSLSLATESNLLHADTH